jgi:hypothetical protein
VLPLPVRRAALHPERRFSGGEGIVDADALILAAPTYFLGANAVPKLIVDRGLAFYAHIERLWEKPSVGVCIAGIPGKEGHGLLPVEKTPVGRSHDRLEVYREPQSGFNGGNHRLPRGGGVDSARGMNRAVAIGAFF